MLRGEWPRHGGLISLACLAFRPALARNSSSRKENNRRRTLRLGNARPSSFGPNRLAEVQTRARHLAHADKFTEELHDA